MKFSVIDTATGEYPDLWEIALKEEWAKSLCYCDMEGFAIEEDGTLILLDECGRHEYCPEDRFEIVPYQVTNADRIRAMTDEELAHWIHGVIHDPLIERDFYEWLDWLKEEAHDN